MDSAERVRDFLNTRSGTEKAHRKKINTESQSTEVVASISNLRL